MHFLSAVFTGSRLYVFNIFMGVFHGGGGTSHAALMRATSKTCDLKNNIQYEGGLHTQHLCKEEEEEAL